MLTTASFYEAQHHRGELFRISMGYPRGRQRKWTDLPFLYPTREIVQAYRGGGITADEYHQGYLEILYHRWAQVKEWMDSLSQGQDLTLLCFEKEGEFCHRQVVAELVRQNRPDFPVAIH